VDIPKDKDYPADAVQCDGCGGNGCEHCADKGWVPSHSPWGRYCRHPDCPAPIPPSQVAVYCSNQCAFAGA